MRCECVRKCTTRLTSGHIVLCVPGDVYDFDTCPEHFQEVTRLSGMGAVIHDRPDVPVKALKTKVTKPFGAKS